MKWLGIANGDVVKVIEPISDEQYNQYKHSFAIIEDFSRDIFLYKALEWNYNDLLEAIDNCLQVYNQHGISYMSAQKMKANVNRHMLNFLSMASTYIEHLKRITRKRYGADSVELKNMQEFMSEQYDRCFSYRFICKLRNYALHCELPIDTINFETDWVKKEETPMNSLQVCLIRDKLLNVSSAWGTPLKEEISNLPNGIEVKKLVNEKMACIELIYLAAINNEISKVVPNLRALDEIIVKFSKVEGMAMIFDMPNPTTLPKSLRGEVIPVDLYEVIKLCIANSSVSTS